MMSNRKILRFKHFKDLDKALQNYRKRLSLEEKPSGEVLAEMTQKDKEQFIDWCKENDY